jgi:hypothetical protein
MKIVKDSQQGSVSFHSSQTSNNNLPTAELQNYQVYVEVALQRMRMLHNV